VLHIAINVLPVLLEAAAEIIQPRLAVAGANQAVLGTFTITGKKVSTLAALTWKRVELVEPELALLLGEDHARTRSLQDVAELVFGIDIVITGIEITVVFQRHSLAAELVVDAHLRFLAHPLSNGPLEMVDERLADVAPIPVIPNLAHEVAPVIGIDRPVGDDGIRGAWMSGRRVLNG